MFYRKYLDGWLLISLTCRIYFGGSVELTFNSYDEVVPIFEGFELKPLNNTIKRDMIWTLDASH